MPFYDCFGNKIDIKTLEKYNNLLLELQYVLKKRASRLQNLI